MLIVELPRIGISLTLTFVKLLMSVTILIMKLLPSTILLCILASCNYNNRSTTKISNDSSKVDSSLTIMHFAKIKKSFRLDSLYVSCNKNAYVIGDSAIKKINYISIKFEPLIYFSDFKKVELRLDINPVINIEHYLKGAS